MLSLLACSPVAYQARGAVLRTQSPAAASPSMLFGLGEKKETALTTATPTGMVGMVHTAHRHKLRAHAHASPCSLSSSHGTPRTAFAGRPDEGGWRRQAHQDGGQGGPRWRL